MEALKVNPYAMMPEITFLLHPRQKKKNLFSIGFIEYLFRPISFIKNNNS
jgi:hypothetical protein